MSKWLVTVNTSEDQTTYIYQFKGELPTETEIRSYISKNKETILFMQKLQEDEHET